MVSITRLSRHLHLGEFITGVLVLSFATSAPELFVGISSALSGNVQLAAGNLIGATILLFAGLAGFAAIAQNGLSTNREIKSHQLLFTNLLILLPVIFLLDKSLSRIEGLFLVGLYSLRLVQEISESEREVQLNQHPQQGMLKTIFHVTFAITLLIISSHFVVASAVSIAQIAGISTLLVGLLILSFGTNLPEITLIATALRKHHQQMALGDIIGSATANSLILGIVALISPFSITDQGEILLGGLFLLAALAFFSIASYTRRHISLKEGYFLVLIYIAFVIAELAIKIV